MTFWYNDDVLLIINSYYRIDCKTCEKQISVHLKSKRNNIRMHLHIFEYKKCNYYFKVFLQHLKCFWHISLAFWMCPRNCWQILFSCWFFFNSKVMWRKLNTYRYFLWNLIKKTNRFWTQIQNLFTSSFYLHCCVYNLSLPDALAVF